MIQLEKLKRDEMECIRGLTETNPATRPELLAKLLDIKKNIFHTIHRATKNKSVQMACQDIADEKLDTLMKQREHFLQLMEYLKPYENTEEIEEILQGIDMDMTQLKKK